MCRHAASDDERMVWGAIGTTHTYMPFPNDRGLMSYLYVEAAVEIFRNITLQYGRCVVVVEKNEDGKDG